MNRRLRSFVDSDPLDDLAPVVFASGSYSGGEKSRVGTVDNGVASAASTAGVGGSTGAAAGVSAGVSAGAVLGPRSAGVDFTRFEGGFWDMNRTGWASARRGIVLAKRENIIGQAQGRRR